MVTIVFGLLVGFGAAVVGGGFWREIKLRTRGKDLAGTCARDNCLSTWHVFGGNLSTYFLAGDRVVDHVPTWEFISLLVGKVIVSGSPPSNRHLLSATMNLHNQVLIPTTLESTSITYYVTPTIHPS